MVKRIKIALLSLAVIGVPLFAFVPDSYAVNAGYFYISPSSTSVNVGNTVTVALRINPQTTIDTVQATVNYNPSLLQFDSDSLGAFSTCMQNSGGGGSVVLACSILGGGTSSDSLVANITFTALAGSGSSSIYITNANAVYAGSSTNPTSSNGTITLTTPPPPPPVSTSHHSYYSYSPVASTSTSSAPTPTASSPAAPPPKASVKVSLGKIQFTGASITVSSDQAVQALVKYGTAKNNLDQSSALSSSGTKDSVSLASSSLTPGTTYYYQAVAEINGTVVGQSAVQSFTTKGFSLSVAVLDSKYRPLVGKVVTLHSQVMKATTNDQGIATFEDVAPGYHHIEYNIGDKTYSQAVYVANNMSENNGIQSAPQQVDAVVLPGLVQPPNYLKEVSVTMSAVLALILIAVLFIFRRTVLHTRLVAHIEKIILNITGSKFARI